MDVKRIGKRGILFSFYDLDGLETNTYVIDGNNNIFIIDTYLGPDTMKGIRKYIETNLKLKPIIVFNSHYHWDHIWGNCEFMSSVIISQERCRELIIKHGEDELKQNGKYTRGDVRLVYPKVTFRERLFFHDEGIELFHSPGHTEDSASLIDHDDKVLFVGDNVEYPIPYLSSRDFDTYINTMEIYLNINAEYMVAGHCHTPEKSLVFKNLDYLKKLKMGTTGEFEKGVYINTHSVNKEVLRL